MTDVDPRERLEKLRDEARAATRQRFVARNGGWYLVGRAELSGPVGRLAFETESFDLQDIPALLRRAMESGEMPAVALALGPGMGEAHPLHKTDPEAWASRITVGRATNNDVVLRHRSVSKVHASFRVGEASGSAEEPPVRLMDVGSHNGTRVNERRVGVDTWTAVADADRVTFGSYQTLLLTATSLYERLRAWRR